MRHWTCRRAIAGRPSSRNSQRFTNFQERLHCRRSPIAFGRPLLERSAGLSQAIPCAYSIHGSPRFSSFNHSIYGALYIHYWIGSIVRSPMTTEPETLSDAKGKQMPLRDRHSYTRRHSSETVKPTIPATCRLSSRSTRRPEVVFRLRCGCRICPFSYSFFTTLKNSVEWLDGTGQFC